LERLGGTRGAIEPIEFEDHAMPSDGKRAHRPSGVTWHEFIAGDLTDGARHLSPIAAVEGWRLGQGGYYVVTYRGIDGVLYDLSGQVDNASGRLVAPAVARATGDVDVLFKSASDLSAAEQMKVAGVLRACYDDVDEAWVSRRVQSISDLAIAWRGDEMLGFAGSGVSEGEIPGYGSCRVIFAGLWIRPDARGLRLGWALQARSFASNLLGAFDFTLLSFASSVTFQMQFPGPFQWPGTTLESALVALEEAPSLIRHLTAQAAIAAGSTAFDEEHWVAHGLEHGTANVTPHDIDPRINALFRHVDQPNGDTLTIPASMGNPPEYLRA
jgi:hypothetical protein